MYPAPLPFQIHVISSAAVRQSALLYHVRYNRQACTKYAIPLGYRNSNYPNRISVVYTQLRIYSDMSKLYVSECVCVCERARVSERVCARGCVRVCVRARVVIH
jgi:hypothetical protein